MQKKDILPDMHSAKGNNYDQKYLGNGLCYTGALIFRGTEALLNYIEACYEKNGSLDNIAQSYGHR